MGFEAQTTHYRAIFISDIHLGRRGCQADLLLDLIKSVDCDRLYLDGE
jgi:UDP-2,3-diacylglucosamine pyrophosphatase LpxH